MREITDAVTPVGAAIAPDAVNPLDFPLLAQRVQAQPDLVRRLLLGFRDQYAYVVADLKHEVAKGNLQEAARLTHSLRSVAAMLGVVRLAESANRLEAQLHPGHQPALNDAILQLEQEVLRVLRAASRVDRRQPKQDVEKHPTRGQSSVLIVDDAAFMREVLQDILSAEYRIVLAADGKEGLRLAKAESPDLILLDVELPDMDGYSLLTQLKEQPGTASIPVVFVTGSSDTASETTGLRLGAVDYVIKPINPPILLARVGSQIKIKRAEVEALQRRDREHYTELVTEFERAALLEETRQLQLKIKDDFLSHVSHELRAPSMSIHAFVSLVMDGLAGEANPQQVEYLGIALRNVEHLQAMIEDLLEAARLGSGKLSILPSDIFVAEAVDSVVQTFAPIAKRKSIDLAAHCPPDLPSCKSDPTRLRQTLTILVDNAIKFSPTGGSVTVGVRIWEQDNTALLFDVADTGCGIAPDKVASVFDRLYQCTGGEGRSNGLGLGLHIAQELIQRQGGKLWVESVVGAGSNFRFTLPISVAKPAALQAATMLADPLAQSLALP